MNTETKATPTSDPVLAPVSLLGIAIKLLEIANCPCCDGSGGYYDSYGNPTQCQWCYEKNQVIAAAMPNTISDTIPAKTENERH